jgi:hypothetical protein
MPIYHYMMDHGYIIRVIHYQWNGEILGEME